MRPIHVVQLVLILSFAYSCLAQGGIAFNSGQLIMQYDPSNINEDFHCQQCYIYELDDDAGSNWHFRFAWDEFLELDANGNACCALSDINCFPEAGTCNSHNVFTLPPVLSIAQSTVNQYGADFTGVYDSEGIADPPTCVPPGSSSLFCGNFKFTNYIITQDTNVSVSNTTNVFVPQASIRNTVRMDTWPFFPGSWGMRLKILIASYNNRLQDIRIYPSNAAVTNPQTNTFTSIALENKNRLANITFSTVARINGSTVGAPVNLSGPYPHEFDLDARYMYVDIPPFASMEYDLFTHIDFTVLNGVSNLQVSIILLLVSIIALIL